MGDIADYYGSQQILDEVTSTRKKKQVRVAREFLRFRAGKFYWIDKEFKEHDIELMEDSYLFNAIQFLYDWAADHKEQRNLELSIMAAEESRRDELKKTEAGKLLYVAT